MIVTLSIMDEYLHNSCNPVVGKGALAAVTERRAQANAASPVPSKAGCGTGKEGERRKPVGPRKMK